MAKVNLERRAEIGQEKRARTRAQLVAAARGLFSTRSLASVTIDDLVREARVAKGTFYTHFDDMDTLAAAVADDLIASFDELIQPRRAAVPDPLLRVALGCNAFIEKAIQDPAWGSLVARMARADPTIGETARARLREDLNEALKVSPRPGFSVELALEAVVGILLQVLAAVGAGRLAHKDRAGAVGAVLGALGAGKREAASTLAKLERARPADRRLVEGESPDAPGARLGPKA
ncbi:MAG: TetR/AcrR family transcriptional regulator [Hyphomicrobiales bacterium]|nr:TetR/AcrR family transcriptional regulator [Hyphomicrobiales bacterium]MBV8440942.1 TetR/AcrR family transcriptional regulator [Hyphomicrobiales bacterium]